MNKEKLLDEILNMPESIQKDIYTFLRTMFVQKEDILNSHFKEIRETRFNGGFICPYCGSNHVKRNGQYRGRQRYKCKDCAKTYNDLTSSPIAGTHYPEKWIEYIRCMINGLSLPKIAKKLKIHISTAFYWRHKILTAIQDLDIEQLSGIVESDETYFLESFKGKKKITHRKPRKRGGKASKRGISKEQACVVVAVDRTGKTLSKMAGMGRVDKDALNNVLGDNIASDACLCTDSAKNYYSFANEKRLKHETVNIRKGVHVEKGIYHIQHVNNYHSRLKGWMTRFNGVATKYMDNYLCWFRYLDLHKGLETSELNNALLIKSTLKKSRILVRDLRPCMQSTT